MRALLLALCCLVIAVARAEAPPQAAIASAHPLATRAGHETLARGGNAFDAAVSVAAALAVVEPYASGLGGGGFFLLHRAADRHQVMLDARERAPLAATRDMYLDTRGEIVPRRSMDGALAAAIPGTPAALAHLAQHYGRLPLAASLAPAIRLAREGFPVDARYRHYAEFRIQTLKSFPETARLLLSDNAVPAPGTRIRQAELAVTLERLAQQGASGFYHGPTAAQLVRAVREAGGIWQAKDLSAYRVIERAPLRGRFRDFRITTAAPPSSGGVALLTALRMLEHDAPDRLDAGDRTHLLVETLRRVFRDRAQHLGDPDFVTIPLDHLLSPEHARQLRAGIDTRTATPSLDLPPVQGAGDETTHLSVLDREGNRVAATLSINFAFGSAFVAPGTGVLLNDEMDDFAAKPGQPNVYGLVGVAANRIEPGKRPLSSMTPTFLDSATRTLIVGTPGGGRIISMMLLSSLALMEGATPGAAIQAPRFHHQYLPDTVQYEPGAFSDALKDELELRGHVLTELEEPYGNMQVVEWNRAARQVRATSDPRGSGAGMVR